MSTVGQTVGRTPVDITAGAVLLDGTSYLCQCIGGADCYVGEAADGDTPTIGHTLNVGEAFELAQRSGFNIFAWSSGPSSALAVTET